MVWQAAIPAIIGAVGSLAGGLIGSKGAKGTNKTNLEIARQQMEFQERMSNTSYQRGVEDMRKAGLNPILAYSQGGASSPPGATTRVENAMAPLASGASQAAGLVGGIMQQIQSAESANLMHQQAAKAASETMDVQLNSARLAAEIANIKAQEKRHDAGSKLAVTQADNVQQSILGTIADSASKHAMFQEMNKGSGFAADVKKRVAESESARFGVSQNKALSTLFEGMNPYLESVMRLLPNVSGASKGK